MRQRFHILGRNLHLVLLLVLLASHWVASMHDLCPDDSGDYQDCSICVLGHGLGAALPVSALAPVATELSAIEVAFRIDGDLLIFHREYYSKRAPPTALIAA